MSYIGQTPTGLYTTTNAKDTFSGDASATSFTLSQAGTTNNVDVFVENVRQEPTVAYTVDGTTLTFTAAPVAGTDNIYVVNRGPAELSASHPASQALEAYSGTFTTDVSVGGDVTVGGAFTSQGIDDNASSTAVTIDGSGNVGINTGGNSISSHISGSATVLGVLDPNTTNLSSVRLSSGSTFTNGSNIELYAGGAQVGLWGKDNVPITFHTNDTERLRILPTGGITFNGDTSTANALDDYEEGTFTLTLSKTGVTFSPTNTTAYYTKIGNLVHFNYYSSATTTSFSSQSGYMTFSGLPFTSAAGGFRYPLIQYVHGTMFAEDVTGGYIGISGTIGYFVIANTTSNDATVNLGSSLYLMIAGVYHAA